MNITINGKDQDYRGSATLAALLDSLNLGGSRVVVELNGAIVGKPRHAATAVKDGDSVEIVRLVGGG
jgi:thiamine biosynthesis protein ThiS